MSGTDSIDRGVNRGIAWVGLASGIVGILDVLAFFIVIRAGWITIDEWGVAVNVIPFFIVLDLVTDLGLAGAVIQREDHTPEKISTVFWLNVAMSALLVVALIFAVGPVVEVGVWLPDFGWHAEFVRGQIVVAKRVFYPVRVAQTAIAVSRVVALANHRQPRGVRRQGWLCRRRFWHLVFCSGPAVPSGGNWHWHPVVAPVEAAVALRWQSRGSMDWFWPANVGSQASLSQLLQCRLLDCI